MSEKKNTAWECCYTEKNIEKPYTDLGTGISDVSKKELYVSLPIHICLFVKKVSE